MKVTLQRFFLEDAIDYSLPLEVTFTGESSQDYGRSTMAIIGLH